MKQPKIKSKQIYSMALAACLVLSSSAFPSYAGAEASGYSLEYDYSDEDFNLATSSNAFNPLMLRSARNTAEIATVNITNATTKDSLKTEVENALNAGKDVIVTGSCDNINGIEITIPDDRKIIWKANITSNSDCDEAAIVTISGGRNSVFELAEGQIEDRHVDNVCNVFSFLNMVTAKISGGSIKSLSSTDISLISGAGDTTIHISGGEILADHLEKTGINSYGKVIMDGGKIFTGNDPSSMYGRAIIVNGSNPSNSGAEINGGLIFGEAENADNLIQSNNNTPISINGGAVVAYSSRSPQAKTHYLKNSTKLLSVKPESAQAYWDSNGTDSGVTIISSTGRDFKAYSGITVGEIKDYTLPANTVYDAQPHLLTGVPKIYPEAGAGQSNGTINIKYKTASGAEVAAPKDAGQYDVYAVVSGSNLYPDDEIKLGSFEISKRPLRLVIDNKTMTANQPVPGFTYRIEGLAGAESEAEALNGAVQLSANTDGRTPGVFDISLSSALNYKPNYMAAPANAVVAGKLTVNASGSNNNQGNSNQNNNNNNQGGNNSGSGSGSGSRSSGGGSGSGGSGSSGRGAGIIAAPANNNSKGSWIQDEKGWWYKNSDGSWPASKWLQIEYGGKTDWYYFNSEGYMATGWQLINNKWYYLYENTEGSFAKGSLAVSTTIAGYKVNENGEWIQ